MTFENLFEKHGLALSRLRDQGYDGASNMSGEFNGFKTLIMSENNSTHYVHCFARAGPTRWSSLLSTLNSMIILFFSHIRCTRENKKGRVKAIAKSIGT
jgi:hypothetical protein